MNDLMAKLMKVSAKPRLFEPGEPRFWNDPHISKSMLRAHLDPNHDAASRMPEIIGSTVGHLLNSRVLTPGLIYHNVPSIMQRSMLHSLGWI